MSPERKSQLRHEAATLFRLGGPLMINNLAVAGMQFADAVMAGRLGTQSLAAVAVGASVWFLGFSLVLGVMMAISPIVARHYGAKQHDLVGRYTRQGLYLGILFGSGITLFGNLLAEPLLTWFGIDEDFRALTVDYVAAISWGGAGIFMFLALRFTTEGVGHTKPIMYTSIFALTMNVFLNWVLAFGNLGAPALGAVGLGYASAITMWLVMFALLIYCKQSVVLKPFHLFSRVAPLRISVLRELLVLGIPISITITAETGLFSMVSVLMGTRGTDITAAHQIAINFASTMFMIPLALSAASTIRVGHLLGANDPARARFAGGTGIVMCALFMTVSAVFMLLFRDLVVNIYTDDVTVKGIAISLLLVAAIFQIADGVQIGAAGVLRGYKDTRMPMLINVFSFWGVGFPLAYAAAIPLLLAPNFIWGGLIAGLSMAAFLLTWRYLRLSKRALREAA